MPFIIPENYYGNIEYKYNINEISHEKSIRYRTQFNFRLNEGNGTVYYLIGVLDNGIILGLSYEDLIKSIDNLITIIDNKNEKYSINYEIQNVKSGLYFSIIEIISNNYIHEFLI